MKNLPDLVIESEILHSYHRSNHLDVFGRITGFSIFEFIPTWYKSKYIHSVFPIISPFLNTNRTLIDHQVRFVFVGKHLVTSYAARSCGYCVSGC